MTSFLIPLCIDSFQHLLSWSNPQPPQPPPGLDTVGRVELMEDVFPVHSKVSVHLVYTATEALSPGDIIRVEEPIFHGMRWAKWGYLTPQASRCEPLSETEEASAGLVTAYATSGSQLTVRHSVSNSDIHAYGTIDVEFTGGGLPPGEELHIYLGVEQDDCGWQTANRSMENVPIRVFELRGEKEAALLDPSPTFSFVAEDTVAYWKAFVPSQAGLGESVRLRLVPLDRWGNLVRGMEVEEEWVTLEEEGVHRLERERDGVSVVSNPIRISAEPPPYGVYWGDLHTHHGHSYEDDEGQWVDTNHRYARDVISLDFASESVKAPPHELGWETLWGVQQRSCREYSLETEYVAILGFEWMGDASEGHHNVYFDGCDAPQGSADFMDLEHDLWPFMESVEAEYGVEAISIPHATAYTGYNWKVRSEQRTVAEVYSEWGSSMDEDYPGSIPEGLRAGNRMGLIAASDNHDGWLGNTLARKNTPGGLGAILAEELSAPSLLQAMEARRSYATSGERILLHYEVEDEGVTHHPGEEWVVERPVLRWSVAGTNTIESVALKMTSVPAREETAVWAEWTPGTLDAEGELELPWGHYTMVYWLEVTQVDGEKAWSSPVWLDPPDLAESSGCGGGGSEAWMLLPLMALMRRRQS